MRNRVVLLAILLAIVSCEPRGETRTLDEVFTQARADFQDLLADDVEGEVKAELDRLNSLIDKFSSERTESEKSANEIASALSALSIRAGYTSRPSIGELINSYRNFADGRPGEDLRNYASRAKLLAARSYWALSGELKGVKFRLKERELKQ